MKQWHALYISLYSYGRCGSDFQNIIFKLIIQNSGSNTHYEIAFWWLLENITDEKSILVYVTAWFQQATSHYLNQYWTRSISPNGVTKPQWIKLYVTFMCNLCDSVSLCWSTSYIRSWHDGCSLPGTTRHQAMSSHCSVLWWLVSQLSYHGVLCTAIRYTMVLREVDVNYSVSMLGVCLFHCQIYTVMKFTMVLWWQQTSFTCLSR